MNNDPTQLHWDAVYGRRAPDQVSWFEADPAQSLAFIARAGIDPHAALIDVGGGASLLVDRLLERGCGDVTVLDVSAAALELVEQRLRTKGLQASLLASNVLDFAPARTYSLWHDRAVFHFLTAEGDRARYRDVLLRSTAPGSHIVMATFGPDGPTRCSNLDTSRYGATSLADILGTSLQLVESTLTTHTTPAAIPQQFLYAWFIRL